MTYKKYIKKNIWGLLLYAALAYFLWFASECYAQTVTWTNLTATAELGRQQSLSLLDNANNVYVIGGGINDEIVSYNGSQYYVVSGTASTSYPYYLSSKNNNAIYSKILSEQYIYSEALNNTYNVFSCTGSSPYPGAVIWQSPDGVNWTSTVSTADPLNGAVIEFNGYIFRLGGVCPCPTPVYSNNVARSTDGVTFTTLTTSGVFSARDQIIPIVATNGATLYAVGGENNGTYYASVYSTTNGTTWSALTTSAAFGNITQGGAGWSYNNVLYVYNNASGLIYSSIDGATWTAVAVVGGAGPTLQFPSALYAGNNSLLVIGGYTGSSYPNTSWYAAITNAFTPTLTPVYSTSATATPTVTVTFTATPNTTTTSTPACPVIVLTTTVSYAANYGATDPSGNFWIADYTQGHIYGINQAGSIIHTFGVFNYIVQMVYLNGFLYAGCGDAAGHFQKVNASTGAIPYYTTLNPTSLGNGGVQGVIYDGTHIWCGVSQQGGGAGSGLVLAFNPTTNAIDLTITGQTNVNGMAYSFSGGQEYIFSACSYVTNVINATTGAYTSVATDNNAYRVCSDGVYFYVASYNNPGTVRKFRIFDNALMATWTVGSLLNSIASDGTYVYTVGDDNNVNVINPSTGTVVCTITNGGQTDVVFDTFGYFWTASLVSGGSASDYVSKFQIITAPTLTPTITATFTVTPVSTPNLTFVKADSDGNIYLQWNNTDYNNTYLLQYGVSLENSITLTQSYNQSLTTNLFCYKLCCLVAGLSYQVRVTQYNPNYSAVVSNVLNITPTPTPVYNFNVSSVAQTPVATTGAGVMSVGIVGANGQALNLFDGGSVPVSGWWHSHQHECMTLKYTVTNTLAANTTVNLGLYNPNSTYAFHPRFSLITSDGVATLKAYNLAFGPAGTTMVANFLGPCTPVPTPPVMYFAPTPASGATPIPFNTPTANQVGETIFTGGSDATNPNGSMVGNSVAGEDSDWFAILPSHSYLLQITSGATAITYSLTFGMYEDNDNFLQYP